MGCVAFFQGSSPNGLSLNTILESSSDFCTTIRVIWLSSGIGPNLETICCSSSQAVAAKINGGGSCVSKVNESRSVDGGK